MKKILFAALAATTMFASCSKDEVVTTPETQAPDADKDSVALLVNAFLGNDAESRAGFDPKASFTNNDAIGLFVYKGSWGTGYNDIAANVKSTRTSSGWNNDPAVYLTHEKAKVWAYSPHSTSLQDGNTTLPVDITANKVDYLYGVSNEVSIANPVANIKMKHALTQFVLRIKPSSAYSGAALVTAASLTSKSVKFHKQGKMNIQTGAITQTDNGANSIAWEPNIKKAGGNVDFNAVLFPMTVKSSDITLEVTIDGQKYNYVIPEASWVAGKRNVYSISLKSNGIEIGGSNGSGITIEEWTEANTDVTLKPVV